MIILAYITGWIHAIYGSGIFKKEDDNEQRIYGNYANLLIKWGLLPMVMINAVYWASHLLWFAIIVFLPPALAMMFGTGGDNQAHHLQTKDEPKEQWPLDQSSAYMADITAPFNHTHSEWCRHWGFWFATQIGAIYALPFIFTNQWYLGFAMLTRGIWCRYFERRFVEFGFTAFYMSLILWAIL